MIKQNRSRTTNDTSYFHGNVDGRSASARRFRDVYLEILEELGGTDNVTGFQRQIAKGCAGMTLVRERMESEVVAGNAVDFDIYVRLIGALRRALNTLGLKQRASIIQKPTIDDFLGGPDGEADDAH